jgi:tRNA modification GTPase
MEKSREILKEADLKIHVVDGCEFGVRNSEFGVGNQKSTTDSDVTVISKCDLLDERTACGLQTRDERISKVLPVSSKTGEGLAELRQKMDSALFTEGRSPEDIWITSERERACLAEAFEGVKRALDLLQKQPAVELLAFEMQLVRRSLQSVVGEISSEDILQSIFAGFCIGK